MLSGLTVLRCQYELPGLPGWPDKAEDLHGGLAFGTGENGSRSWCTGIKDDVKYKLQ